MPKTSAIVIACGIVGSMSMAHGISLSDVCVALKARQGTVRNIDAHFNYKLESGESLRVNRRGTVKWERDAVQYDYENHVLDGGNESTTQNIMEASAAANYDHVLGKRSGVISPTKTLGQGMTIDGLTTLEGGRIDLLELLGCDSAEQSKNVSISETNGLLRIVGQKIYGPGRGTDFELELDPKRQYSLLSSRWSHFVNNQHLTTSTLTCTLSQVSSVWLPVKTQTVSTTLKGTKTSYSMELTKVKVNDPSYKRDPFLIPKGTVVSNALDNRLYTLKKPTTVEDILNRKIEPDPIHGAGETTSRLGWAGVIALIAAILFGVYSYISRKKSY